ncbi:hypothetical protein CKO28_20840 [Rhodovibrio sodomensis]|uniref:HAD family hydrolase n=1 Tax=Rhodovibrio sodomensis TaxID=1088 RepID=A0ABS1DKG4_9PROT|nr:hypothetical protein [Rhodovibrio sodomensis]
MGPGVSVKVVGFDADGTLWRHINFIASAIDAFVCLIDADLHNDALRRRLVAMTEANLAYYEFGAKRPHCP